MTTVAIVLIVSVFAFAVLGVPLAWSLGLSSLCAILTTGTISLGMLAQRMYTGGAVYAFLAIFFFIFAGNIMTYGGLSKRLIRFANGLVGHHTGGTSIVCTLACTFFAAISGSSIATTAAIGGMLYPELKDYGYPDDYAATLPAVGGVLGIVIPPSVTFIVYGTTLNISVGKLLFSGVVPGILGSIALSVMCYIFAKKRNYPKGEKMNRKEFWKVAWEAGPALLTPLIILGGIYSGLFTPTESAAVAVIYALLISFFVYKDMTLKDFGSVLIDSSISTATILMMVGLSKSSSYVVTVSGLPETILNGFASFTDSPIVILLLINILFLIIGMLMEANAAIVMMTPLLLPLMKAFGVDTIQFGIVMSFNLCIGLITPPVGICMLMGNQLAGSKLSAALKAVAPMLLMSLIILMLITYIPALTTWLPGFLAE